MPLLHKAPYTFKTVPQNLEQSDEVFHIPATNEVFKTYDEYIAKQQLYTKEVWSCALTGKSGLTLEEALELENSTRSKLDKFPLMLEKPTLLLAHHSNKNLDWMASTLTAEFKRHCVPGELINVQYQGTQHVGKIVDFLTSLDAEENDDQFTYKVMLSPSGEILNDIAHSKIQRKIHCPSKDLIKMFIREHTTKSSNMFNVKKDMLVKYAIPHKFASITSVLRSPAVGDVPGKKKQPPKAKCDQTPNSSKSKQKNSPKTPVPNNKDSSSKSDSPKMIKIHSVGPDGKLITTWKAVPSRPIIIIDSDEETTSKPATLKSTPPKPSTERLITPKPTPEKAKKTPLTDEQKREKKQRRVENKEMKEFTTKVQSLAEKYIKSKDANTTITPSKMKQTTLLNFSNKEKISHTIREIINAEDNGYRRSMIINELAKSMTNTVSQKLPLATPVKSLLMEKREKLLEKEKLAKMSPTKRADYFKAKEEMRIAMLQKKREEKMAEQQRLKEERQKEREAEREKARALRLEQMHLQKQQRQIEREKELWERQHQRVLAKIILEDLALEDLSPLPEYIPLDLGEGYTVDTLPQVALVADIVSNFRSVFVHEDDDTSYTADFLMQAAQGGCRGHRSLSNLLQSILSLLSQEGGDKVDVDNIHVPLGTIDLNQYNIGACIRSFLKSLTNHSEETKLQQISVALENVEFYDLVPHQKIFVIYILCEEVIKSRTFTEAIQENLEKASQARRTLQVEQIERNKRIAADQLAKMTVNFKSSLGGIVNVKDDTDSDDCRILEDEEEEREKEEDQNVEQNGEEEGDEGIGSDEEDNISNLAYAVKQRREDVKKRKLEEAEEKIRQQAEREKERKIKEQRAQIDNAKRKEENLKNEIETLRSSIRNESLGQDRNHSRYWIFNGCPGLYIERGWWPDGHFSPIEKQEQHNTSGTSGESEDSGIQDKLQIVVPEKVPNQWYIVPSLVHYDNLKKSLSIRGVREKQLLANLRKEDDKIRTAIRKYNYPSKAHRFIGNEDQTARELKKDIITMDQSLGYAGLGGDAIIPKLLKPVPCPIDLCIEAMLAIQASVEPKYMKKPLASSFKVFELIYQYNAKVQIWISLVKDAKTFSQLHMLLSMFDNCVQWEKSIENVKCKACKKKGDENKLLICDVCDTGYHCGCLRPPLRKVPEDSWLCPSCRPSREEASSDSGECSDEDEEDEDNDDVCCVCDYGGELLLCDKCPSAYHLECHDPPLKRIPRGDWACYSCISATVEVSTSESSDDEDESCAICSKGGKTIVCHQCDNNYHMRCHDPILKAIPSKKWQCSWCKGPTIEEQRVTSSKKRASKGVERASKKRKLDKKPTKPKGKPKKQVIEESEDEEEEDEEEEDEEEEEKEDDEEDDEEESTPKKLNKKPTKPKGKPKKQVIEESEDEKDDDDEEEEKEEEDGEEEDEEDDKQEITPRKSETRGRRNSALEEDRAQRSKRRSLKRGIDKNLEICEEIITDLLKIPQSADFIDLVDKKKVPDYYELIARPVCLDQIREKTLYLQYDNSEEFINDVTTLLDNCFDYNMESSEVYENGKVLETSFISMLKSRLPTQYKILTKSRHIE